MFLDPATTIWHGGQLDPGRGGALRPGTAVGGRYRIEERIGSGDFGTVYRASELRNDREVTLKVIHAEFVSDDKGSQRFEREAALALRLRHPNTLVLYDYGIDSGVHYIVSDLLTGRSLWEELRETGCFSTERAAYVAKQVLKALAEAHDLGIVHRDIKPTNVFLAEFRGERDFVKVLDFGIAKDLNASQITEFKEAADAPRTPRYMAPEQFLARKASAASDLYAVGLVMAEMIDGAPVYKKGPWDCVQAKLEQPETLLPQSVLDSPLAPVIQRACQQRREARHGSAMEMLADMETATAPVPIPSAPCLPPAAPEPASPPQPPDLVPPSHAAQPPAALSAPASQSRGQLPLPPLPLGMSIWNLTGIAVGIVAMLVVGVILAVALLRP